MPVLPIRLPIHQCWVWWPLHEDSISGWLVAPSRRAVGIHHLVWQPIRERWLRPWKHTHLRKTHPILHEWILQHIALIKSQIGAFGIPTDITINYQKNDYKLIRKYAKAMEINTCHNFGHNLDRSGPFLCF